LHVLVPVRHMATEAAPCQATGLAPEDAIAAPDRGYALGGDRRRH
jgi:hypothetical protein